MKNANYNLVKLLLAKLDDAWRVEQHYRGDAEEHGCQDCQRLLERILKSDHDQIEEIKSELAKHIKDQQFD